MEGEVVGSKSNGCMSKLPIKKKRFKQEGRILGWRRACYVAYWCHLCGWSWFKLWEGMFLRWEVTPYCVCMFMYTFLQYGNYLLMLSSILNTFFVKITDIEGCINRISPVWICISFFIKLKQCSSTIGCMPLFQCINLGTVCWF